MRIRIALIFFLAFCAGESLGQSQAPRLEGNSYLSLLGGYNAMYHQFWEIGIAKNQLNRVGNSMFGYNYFLSTEIGTASKTIWGPKIGFWVTNGLGLGMNMIYYTDGNWTRFCFRPEAGLGLARFKVAYGYNFSFGKSHLQGVNEHNVTLQYLFTLKTLKNKGNPDEM